VTRSSICALAVFARQGFHETSIAAICAQAHIARGTLYQYFTDKRGVLAALIERYSAIVAAGTRNSTTRSVSPFGPSFALRGLSDTHTP
jgi:AcrR family transcriptional regulator